MNRKSANSGRIRRALEQELRAAIGNVSLERFVLEHGKAFRVGPFPPDVERGSEKDCYFNAASAVLGNDEYLYAEGFAFWRRHAQLFQHAWCVWKGNAFDPTLKCPEEFEYLGITLSQKELLPILARQDGYRVLKYETINDFTETWRTLRISSARVRGT